jgi:uncharacterized membrane protein
MTALKLWSDRVATLRSVKLSAPDDHGPRVVVNKGGWKVATVASTVVALSLLAALLAQGGLFDASNEGHPDGLTTLALVLAVLAFLIQIFVFIFQTESSNASLRRSEHLNAETREVLSKIETDSAATQKVLFSQFDRLLDYIVGGSEIAEVPAGEEEEADDLDAVESSQDEPLTAAQVTRMINEAARLRDRPQFELQGTGSPSEEDRRMIAYMSRWPSREEAERAVAEVAKLSPLAIAILTRMGMYELKQRRAGGPVSLKTSKGRPGQAELLEAGLTRVDGKRIYLSDLGRDFVRVLPIGKSPASRPDWADEVLAPLYAKRAE